MARIHRRTFVERLGLGAGAALLGPTVGRLVSEAQGAIATSTRKRIVIVVQGNGMNYKSFGPPGHKPDELEARRVDSSKLYVADNLTTMAQMFTPLASYKDRMLYVDGLSSFVRIQDHSLTFGTLTGLSNLAPDSVFANGGPGGQSFDQYLATSALGKGVIFPSILHGVTGIERTPDKPLMNMIFAHGRNKPATHMAYASVAYRETFTNTVGPTTSTGAPPYNRRKKLLDFLRDDARRARAALAGSEAARLDQVLGSIETLDKRMAETEKMAATARANLKLAPVTTEPATIEERCDVHMQIAATALVANLTNVIGYSATAGLHTYEVWSGLGLALSSHDHGHGETEGKPIHPLDMVHMFFGGLILKAMRTLDAIPEGDGTMLDNTIFLWLSDQAEQHHPIVWRWPALVIASPKTGLKTGGRFVRYPLAKKPYQEGGVPPDPVNLAPTPALVADTKAPGGRCLADLYCTLAHVLGVPTDTFGSGEGEAVQGPLPELL